METGLLRAFWPALNERGNLLLVIMGLMLLAIFVLPLAMYAFKPLDIIVRVILIFVLFTTVRGYLGNSVITIIITAVLVYFLVFKWWWIGASGWLFLTLMGIGFFGLIVWGTSKIIPHG